MALQIPGTFATLVAGSIAARDVDFGLSRFGVSNVDAAVDSSSVVLPLSSPSFAGTNFYDPDSMLLAASNRVLVRNTGTYQISLTGSHQAPLDASGTTETRITVYDAEGNSFIAGAVFCTAPTAEDTHVSFAMNVTRPLTAGWALEFQKMDLAWKWQSVQVSVNQLCG